MKRRKLTPSAEGSIAVQRGVPLAENPYGKRSRKHAEWADGHRSGQTPALYVLALRAGERAVACGLASAEQRCAEIKAVFPTLAADLRPEQLAAPSPPPFDLTEYGSDDDIACGLCSADWRFFACECRLVSSVEARPWLYDPRRFMPRVSRLALAAAVGVLDADTHDDDGSERPALRRAYRYPRLCAALGESYFERRAIVSAHLESL